MCGGGFVDGILAPAGVAGVCRGGMFTEQLLCGSLSVGLAALQCRGLIGVIGGGRT